MAIEIILREGKITRGKYQPKFFKSKGTLRNNLHLLKLFVQGLSRTDLVHYHYPNFFFPDVLVLPLFLISNLFWRRKVVVHIHLIPIFRNFLWKVFLKPYFFILKILLRSSKAVITPTRYTKQLLIQQFGVNYRKIYINPYGVAKIFFKEIRQEGVKNKPKSILYLGRLDYRKGIDKLIKAVKNLPEGDFKLEIYGKGPELENLQQLAENRSNIVFHGFVDDERKIKNAFNNADLMVLPSLAEEMPLSILEALAARVPVLCTRLPSIYDRYKTLIFYTTGEIEDVHQKILKITSSPLEDLLENAKDFAQKYSWKSHFSRLARIYRVASPRKFS